MKGPAVFTSTNDAGKQVFRYELRLVCTDKGTHPSREIGVLIRDPDDDEMTIAPTDKLGYRSNGSRNGRASARVKEPLTHEGKNIIFDDVTWRFRCPTCRREVQWRLGRAVKTVDTLIAAGVGHVDLSRLPATIT